MKAHLLFADHDLDLEAPEPANAADLVSDLDLSTLIRAMAAGDEVIASVAHSVLLHPLSEPATVGYRQQVLGDCLRQPNIVRILYDVAGEALAGERGWPVEALAGEHLHQLVDPGAVADSVVRLLRRSGVLPMEN